MIRRALLSHSRTLLLAVTCLAALSAFGTPRMTYEEIAVLWPESAHEQIWSERQIVDRYRTSLDDPPPYFLHYSMLCEFLNSMQYTGQGNNRGGMIEGESGGDQNIIETDNTQEAIRVWSQYAIWTGDTSTYHQNIVRAWEYCWRYPAWREGGGGFSYYSAHNCGWGFEAVWKYREAYGDTSLNIYADSCAMWMATHPLSGGQLDRFAEALGLGGMYAHAVYRGRQDWTDWCLTRARVIRSWLLQNPAQLHLENWALCGGTAFWGVANSLFVAYPDTGIAFLAQVGDQLQVWESAANWNHSHCAWYANAQHRAFEIAGDSMYWNNAVFIGDSLIGLDTDNDGGIYPGVNGYSPANDHSWVSAYMGWMGMERPINNLPGVDAAMTAVVLPNPDLPHPAGSQFLLAVRVTNAGFEPFSAQITASIGPCEFGSTVVLDYGRDSLIVFVNPCTIADDNSLPDSLLAEVIITAEEDDNRGNDTLRVWLDFRRRTGMFGAALESGTEFGIPATQLRFYHEAYPDSAWYSTTTDGNGDYSTGTTGLMAGRNIVRVTPPIQYVLSSDTVVVTADNSPVEVDIAVERTEIALIDDDAGEDYETFFSSALSPLDRRIRYWERASGLTGSLVSIPNVIWFTGDDSVTTLLSWDETTLTEYLASGGHLLLTGQNITEDLGASSAFLTQTLRCSVRTHDTNIRTVNLTSGHALADSMRLVLQGTQGANNQNSTSSLWVLPGSEAVFEYAGASPEVAGVTGAHNSGKYMFLGFGVEAISGANSSTTRSEFFDALMVWFELSGAEKSPPGIPASLQLSHNYPNPFNSGTTIRFIAPLGTSQVDLGIFNLLGQQVTSLYSGAGTGTEITIAWDGRNQSGQTAASGEYLLRLNADGRTIAHRIHLIR